MLAGMAHYIFANNLQDQKFIDKFCQGMDAGTMPDWAKGKENFKDYILGKYDNTPKTPEWAEKICGVPAADIRKLADMYATTKPAALKASWAPGRNAYGEQYNRMAAAVQAMTGNIGILGGCAEGVGKGWHAESVAYPYDEYANVWYASIKSDRWAHCVLNYPNVKREEIGCWPRDDKLDGDSQHQGIFWHGSDWFNQLTNINKEIEAIKKLELVVCMDSTITPSGCGPTCCCRSPRTSSATTWRCPGTRATTTSTGPRSSSRWASRRPTSRCSPSSPIAWSARSGAERLRQALQPEGRARYFDNPDAVDEAYLVDWWKNKVQDHQGVTMSWEEFKKRGVYKFEFDAAARGLPRADRAGQAVQDALRQDRDLLDDAGQGHRLDEDAVRLPDPAIPKWIEPFESLNHPKAKKHPFHMITPHPRWRTHSIFHNIPWLRETYQQESHAQRLAMPSGSASAPATSSRSGTSAARSWCRPTSPSAACRAWWCCTKAPGWTSTRTASIAPAIRIS
jgi:anaerobic dimethyl sulfoxide reductase subunit A